MTGANIGWLNDWPRWRTNTRGVPPKLTEAQREQLRLWASTKALTARQLLTKMKDEFDMVLHPNTLGTVLKKMHLVWKRTRYSLEEGTN